MARSDSFDAAKEQYLRADFKSAAKSFHRLADSDPRNAEYLLWVGRVYDRWADVSSPLTTKHYSTLAREYFERAVALDPTNREAYQELLHSYLNGERFGGTDWKRASTLAERISGLDRQDGKAAADLLKIRQREMHSAEEIFVDVVQAPSDIAGSLVK
jgi:tetratricopeptide (TPR) repeat protein